ncbi:metal-dependentamidase/aminoacylase/ carboxypeptidase [Leptospira ryugenii]|uniref:Metal-dependentamidase/aminoacylase/ carboxypeptidase n=1 Tax=Leptospira ryugenii TaxID=1917863 RepID=A0A2P2DX18_9LEPT|nr:amidohydrolase [Leptospira ryugenii]GBF49173.1 metal-dependentamidase/aminoacylase/ carboxypeptidase [Leptospira ryugenii]
MKPSLPNSGLSDMVQYRRTIHKTPELKYEEEKTAAFVTKHLSSLNFGFEDKIAETGVVCLVDSGNPGPTVMVRADMDALPIFEETKHEYKSQIDGKMHACGHDGHTSILMKLASDLKTHLQAIVPKGRVLLCFQPAEEGGSGANRMIEAGILEKYHVDACFALHLWNHIDIGKVGVVDGTMMASVDEFVIRVQGRSGHGALPQHTVDPILVGSHLVTALQSIVSRNVDPLEPCVVTVGSFHAGNAFNVIPESAELKGTVRTYSKEVYNLFPERLESLVRSVAKGFGADIDFKYTRIDKPTINDPEMANIVRQAARNVLGSDCLTEENTRTMGGEDFSAFLMARPGCYFFIGSRNEKKGLIHPHHSSFFDFDEDAMPVGLAVMKEVIRLYLSKD